MTTRELDVILTKRPKLNDLEIVGKVQQLITI